MKKGERTRQGIIETTAPLFNTRGFDGTSLSILCEATGLTKGALYGNFLGKEDLYKASFQYAMSKVRACIRKEVDRCTTNKEKLLAVVDFFARYVLDPPIKGGCPLLNTAIEADDHRKSMKKLVAVELELTISFLTQLIENGKKTGEFLKSIKSREVVLSVFCSIEGAIMFSRVSSSEEAMDVVVKNIKNQICSICI